jgi:hypothetical protein
MTGRQSERGEGKRGAEDTDEAAERTGEELEEGKSDRTDQQKTPPVEAVVDQD